MRCTPSSGGAQMVSSIVHSANSDYHFYLDCSFMFVQMRAMSAYHGAFSSNPALVRA
jgi:hypothetical protein